MSQPYMGEIRQVSFPFAPRGWALCIGQLMAISQNAALFSLLGTQFGGDGIRTFGLPDLRGRSPIGGAVPNGLGLPIGTENVTMTLSQLPLHTHTAMASTTVGTTSDPTGGIWAQVTDGSGNLNKAFTTATPDVTMDPSALASTGTNLPIPIMQPYCVTNYIIALSGIFPSRS